jgi:hypothetical protein
MGLAGPDANRVASSLAICPGRHFIDRNDQKKSADEAALALTNSCWNQLLDLGFFEFHMLAHNWIILLHGELFRLGAGVLFGHIEETGVCS